MLFELKREANHLSIVKNGRIVETYDHSEYQDARKALDTLNRGSRVKVLYLDSATEVDEEVDLVVFQGEKPLKKAKSFLKSKNIYAVNLRQA